MNTFAKTASLQSIENEILKIWMSGEQASGPAGQDQALEPQPLTNQQAGVFLECMKAPQETLYNIPMVWTFPGEVSAEALQEAVQKVLAAHPALQSRFDQVDGQVCQVPTDLPVPVTIQEGELEAVKESFILPFDLSKGPLAKVVIVPGKDKTYLLSDFHHLVFDGRSYDLFIEELCSALEGPRKLHLLPVRRLAESGGRQRSLRSGPGFLCRTAGRYGERFHRHSGPGAQ